MPERPRLGHASRMQVRFARIVILAILIGIGVNHVVFAIRDWPLGDMDVYLAAATRLREGEPLYVAGDVAVNSYWYAPWYAVLWIPLTHLPREVVAVGWSLVLLIATASVTWHLARERGAAALLALLVAPPLFAVSAGGNVQALMLLALLVGLHRRWGPLAIAAAASLKFAPILLVTVYVARREWWRAAATLAISAALLIPSYLMGITEAGVQSEAAPSLIAVSPLLYGAAIVVSALIVLTVPLRFAPLAASAGAVLALPRLFVYDVTTVAVGAAREPMAFRSRRRSDRGER